MKKALTSSTLKVGPVRPTALVFFFFNVLVGFLRIRAVVNDRKCFSISGNKPWPIRVGCVDPRFQTSAFSLPTLQCLSGKDPYFICVESDRSSWTRKPKVNPRTRMVMNQSLSWISLPWAPICDVDLGSRGSFSPLRKEPGRRRSSWACCRRASSAERSWPAAA